MRALKAVGMALIGLIAGYVVVAVLCLMLIPGTGADNGGREMGIFFGLAPVGAIIAAIVAALVALRRSPGKRTD